MTQDAIDTAGTALAIALAAVLVAIGIALALSMVAVASSTDCTDRASYVSSGADVACGPDQTLTVAPAHAGAIVTCRCPVEEP